MSVDLDDPRLTAYALGELDPADREAIEASLRDDPEGRALVAGIQETARLLTEELGHEPTLVLDAARRGAIEGRIAAPTIAIVPVVTATRKRRFPIVPLAIAASLIGVAVVLLQPAVQSARRVARRTSGEGLAYVEPSAPVNVLAGTVPQDEAEATPKAVARRAFVTPPPHASNAPLAISGPSSSVSVNEKGSMDAPAASLAKKKERLNDALGVPLPAGAKPAQQPGMKMGRVDAQNRNLASRAQSPSAASSGMLMGGMGGSGGMMGMARGVTQPAAPAGEARSRSRGEVARAPDAKSGLDMFGREGGQSAPGTAAPSEGKSPQTSNSYSDRSAGEKVLTDGTVGPGIVDFNRNSGLPQTQTSASNLVPSQKPGANNTYAYMPPQGVANGPQAPVVQFKAGLGAVTINGQYPALEAQQATKDAAAAPAPAAAPAGLTKLGEAPVALALQDVDRNAANDQAPDPSKATPKILIVGEEAEQVDRKADFERNRIGREEYARFYDNPFVNVLPDNRLSTFSIDVDTAAYANVRRFLSQGQLPPVDAVRIEEMVNYFTYDDPAPKGDVPFSVNVEVAACPWNAAHRLARIGLNGKSIDVDKRPATNLVFLVDVSGSMDNLNKLPLLKAGMKLLVEQLGENDRVAIVTYANGTNVPLPSTSCDHKAEILAALENLRAGGGTNGGAGIELAYQQAAGHFIKGGTNRVILGTDGDFNVGLSMDELLARSEERAKGGICLSVLGFGEGNLQDKFMEQLADKGNGNYSYIDTIQEARKVLVQQLSGTLNVIAKDVKIQLEFNPNKVGSYRLIGYENRVMANEDFRNDKKDAGEIGAGHSVTALYEIVPTGQTTKLAAVDRPFKYAAKFEAPAAGDAVSPELLTVFLRYKQPDGDVAKEINHGVVDDGRDLGRASADFKFSAAVAGFGMLLRESPHKGTLTYPAVREIAGGAVGEDKNGYRKEFLGLVDQARQISGQ